MIPADNHYHEQAHLTHPTSSLLRKNLEHVQQSHKSNLVIFDTVGVSTKAAVKAAVTSRACQVRED
jgi:hypothetical protein